MTMLIKNGLIQTMTVQGAFIGDILAQGGRVEAVGTQIPPPEENTCILDAKGLTILPGLIDAHIQDGPETDEVALRSPNAAGVTTGLLWPETEAPCRILTQDGSTPCAIHTLMPEKYTDAQLHERFILLANDGFRIACEIGSARECRRVLAAVHSTRIKAILVNLAGCDELLEAVALSGCPVVAGVSSGHTCSPWQMAQRLDALGVSVAVTCSYPDAKLRHLPLCAALCVREGMDRERALRTVTTAPAAILTLPEAGVIQPGARADFAIYDGDPLLLATSHVMTISGGKIRH